MGLKGDLWVILHRTLPLIDALDTVFIQVAHTRVPYKLEYLTYKYEKKAIMKLKHVHTAKVASSLYGKRILIADKMLSPTIEHVEVTPEKLLNYSVIDKQEGELGHVINVYTPEHHWLIAVEYQGEELLIPYHQAIIKEVLHLKNVIMVNLPEGFLKAFT